MSSGIEFVETPCTIKINGSFVILTWPEEKRSYPLHVFRIVVDRAVRALQEYDAAIGQVVPFKGRKKDR